MYFFAAVCKERNIKHIPIKPICDEKEGKHHHRCIYLKIVIALYALIRIILLVTLFFNLTRTLLHEHHANTAIK